MDAIETKLGQRVRIALLAMMLAHPAGIHAQAPVQAIAPAGSSLGAATAAGGAPEVQAVADADGRWSQEKSAHDRGMRQLLFGQKIARDALKQSIDAVRAELTTAADTAARAEIERRIASCVQALNNLRASQAIEVESREREATQLAASFQSERSRLLTSARGKLDDQQRAAQQRRDSAHDRFESLRRTIADLEEQRAQQTAGLSTLRESGQLRRSEAVAELARRSESILEPVNQLVLRAQTTTYMDERAKLLRDIEAKQREVLTLREDVVLEQSRLDERDQLDLATRAAAIDALALRVATERAALQSLMTEEREATLALQSVALESARLTRLQISSR